MSAPLDANVAAPNVSSNSYRPDHPADNPVTLIQLNTALTLVHRRENARSIGLKDPDAELSEREQQVLDLLAQGLIYKEIADKLNIGYETVHTYIRRIYEKLQVRTRTEAVAKFLRREG